MFWTGFIVGFLLGGLIVGMLASGIFYTMFRKFGPFVKLFLFKK